MHLKLVQYAPIPVTEPSYVVHIEDTRVVLQEWTKNRSVKRVPALAVSMSLENYAQIFLRHPGTDGSIARALIKQVRKRLIGRRVAGLRPLFRGHSSSGHRTLGVPWAAEE